MSTIKNDTEFRAALDGLDVARQREVGALFVEHVLDLTSDARVQQVLAAARDREISDDAMTLARRTVKAAVLEAHARCGADGDWSEQADYFVARAAEACLKPQDAGSSKSPAWLAAMNARMSRTCHAAETGGEAQDTEALVQYEILARYLDA
jgi:hypothetical protein